MADAPKPYQIITDTILKLLEQGEIPWRKTWRAGKPPQSLASGKNYRGINVFTLSTIATVKGFDANYWLTFKQAKERGGTVRRGEKGTPVVFWKLWEKETKDQHEKGEDADTIPILRYYNVFNVQQCDGIDYPSVKAEMPTIEFEPLAECEKVYQQMPNKPRLEHQGFQPYYSMNKDTVLIPRPELHDSVEDYYATLFHELVHSVAHEKRLNRTTGKRYGSSKYAKEELIAEMGSAFLCGHCQIEKPIIANAAAYIQNWMKSLKDDPKMVVLAGAQAQKAADYILNVKHETIDQNESISQNTQKDPPTAALIQASQERG